ncbi:MAG: hypothetical protein ACRDVE_05145, partial [Actinocrinis sp.]
LLDGAVQFLGQLERLVGQRLVVRAEVGGLVLVVFLFVLDFVVLIQLGLGLGLWLVVLGCRLRRRAPGSRLFSPSAVPCISP